MSEDFLNFIWRYRLFSQSDLRTTSGDFLKIIHPGLINSHAGPDFSQVRILVNNTLWVGCAEVHVRASDWHRHGHHRDKAYNNVVLHIVYDDDAEVYRSDGTVPHTLKIQGRIDMQKKWKYDALLANSEAFPCAHAIGSVDILHVRNQLARALAERLGQKAERLISLVEEFKGSWETASYIYMAASFGFKVNELPFELLARSLPLQVLAKHKNNPLQLESLLFGQAGMLEGPPLDGYQRILQEEYLFLQKKYLLQPIEGYWWKFLRLRPLNFPSLRIAQFAALLGAQNHLFSQIIAIESTKDFFRIFSSLKVSAYWHKHYRFGHESGFHSAKPGRAALNTLLLNSVVATLFAYGKYNAKEELCDRAVLLLESLQAEDNKIVRLYRARGVQVCNASDSQGLLQLKKSFCDKKNCLLCIIGMKLINSD